jgi:hypothetical protein
MKSVYSFFFFFFFSPLSFPCLYMT